MSDRRGSRFVLEVLFLLALAVGLTLSRLSPLEIAGVMLLGWLIVALFEWAAWRNEPHYGSGLPPRYYVPRVDLPPAQPLEQVPTFDSGYPEARDEAPTWIASAALRSEVLGDWPMAAPIAEPEPEPSPEPEPEPAPEPEPVPEPEPEPDLPDVPLPVVPLPPVSVQYEAPQDPITEEDAIPEPDPEPELEPEPEPEPAPSLDAELVRSAQGVAHYSLEPLADAPPKRRFGRGGGHTPAAVEVPARPEGVRALPGRSMRED